MKNKPGNSSFHCRTIGHYTERMSCVFLLNFPHSSNLNYCLVYPFTALAAISKSFLNICNIFFLHKIHSFFVLNANVNMSCLDTGRLKHTQYINNNRAHSALGISQKGMLNTTKEILFLSLVRFSKYFYNLALAFIQKVRFGIQLRWLCRSIRIREIGQSIGIVRSLFIRILLLFNIMMNYNLIFNQSGNLQKTMSYE